MPNVHIQLYKGRTRAQKAQVAKEITDVLERVLGCNPNHTQIIFTDIEKSDWADAGKLADEA